jgi:hypothetical protein
MDEELFCAGNPVSLKDKVVRDVVLSVRTRTQTHTHTQKKKKKTVPTSFRAQW